jgi:hypothetical protein
MKHKGEQEQYLSDRSEAHTSQRCLMTRTRCRQHSQQPIRDTERAASNVSASVHPAPKDVMRARGRVCACARATMPLKHLCRPTNTSVFNGLIRCHVLANTGDKKEDAPETCS